MTAEGLKPSTDSFSYEEDEDCSPLGITETETPRGLQVQQPVHKGKSLHEQRFDLAKYLLYAVAALAAALLIACVWGPADRLDAVKALAPVLFGPLVTLFGTSVAWYYASDKKS